MKATLLFISGALLILSAIFTLICSIIGMIPGGHTFWSAMIAGAPNLLGVAGAVFLFFLGLFCFWQGEEAGKK